MYRTYRFSCYIDYKKFVEEKCPEYGFTIISVITFAESIIITVSKDDMD